MKTSLLFSAALAGGLLVDPVFAATDVSASWQAELAAAQQASHQDAGGRARADVILRAVLDAARNDPPAGASMEAAAAQAAYAVMAVLYPQSLAELDARLAQSLAGVADSAAALAAGRQWGQHVAQVVLAGQNDAVFLNASSFAQAVKASVPPSPVPAMHAEQTLLGPGRYRFNILAGTPGTKGYADGTAAAARFDHPTGIAADAAGNVYVSEYDQCTIRKITPEGLVTTFAGAPGQAGSVDGAGAAARFNRPVGLAVDRSGNVYVADQQNHTIRKIDPAGNVTTLAGKAGEPGTVNGAGGNARLDWPAALTVDDAGNVFFTEAPPYGNFNPRFRRISPEGLVSQPSIAIQPFPATSGISYLDAWLFSLTADHAGNLYAVIADGFTFVNVLKLTLNAQGYYEGRVLPPPTGNWEGRAADPLGSNWDWFVMVGGVDRDNHLYLKNGFTQIRRYAPDGQAEVHYLNADFGGYGYNAMAVDASGRIYVLPDGESGLTGAIEVGMFDPTVTGPVITLMTGDRAEIRGNNTTFKVWATGGSPLSYQWYFNGTPIDGAVGAAFTINVQDVSAGDYHVVVRDNTGSVTSRKAKLTVKEPPVTTASGANTQGTISPTPLAASTGAGSSGGGSFDAGLALAVLGLLAMAAWPGGRTFTIAAVGARGMKERR